MRFAYILAILPALSSCGFFSYEQTQAVADSPINAGAFKVMTVGKSELKDALDHLGPPDRVTFQWKTDGPPITRFEYFYSKRRYSDTALHVPRQEVAAYNSFVRFFSAFLQALRGRPVTLSEMEALSLPDDSHAEDHDEMWRLSEIRASGDELNGRAVRLSDLREVPVGNVPETGGPVSRFLPLNLVGAAEGIDVMRFEFDARGVLILKEKRKGTPETDVAGHLRESVLQ